VDGRLTSADATNITRRRLLKSTAAFVTSSIFPNIIHANNTHSLENTSSRNLAFINLHTNEELNCCYWKDGNYLAEGLSQIDQILRDHRAEEVHSIDQSLLDLLHIVHQMSNSTAPIHVISAYRSAKTNNLLRKNSKGVAKRSLHMQGKAIDIRIPDVTLTQLHKNAISLQAGGVGYYAKSNFIHLDIGRPRTW